MPAMEVELLLIAKLQHGLPTEKSKRIPLQTEITTLKEQYEKELNSSPLSAEYLLELREKLYYLTDIMHECRSLSSSYKNHTLDGRRYLTNTKTELKYKIGLKPVSSDADPNQQISSHRIGANAVATSPERPPYARKSYPTMGKFHGFEENVKAVTAMVMKRQSDDQFKAIAITGKNGIGKTALAQQIFNKKDVKNKFWPRIWICSSKLADQKTVQKTDQKTDEITNEKTEIVKIILKSLGIEENFINHVCQNKKLEGLIYFLHLNLKGKRFLLVLDDIWRSDIEKNKWHDLFIQDVGDKLSHILPKETGGTVIVTTKDHDLAEIMVGKDNVYKVLTLSNENDSLSIFKDEILRAGDERSIEKVEKELLRHCAGVPLAAKVMGRISAYENKLRRSETNEIEQQRLSETNEIEQPRAIVTDEVESQDQIVTGEDKTEVPVSNEIQVASEFD